MGPATHHEREQDPDSQEQLEERAQRPSDGSLGDLSDVHGGRHADAAWNLQNGRLGETAELQMYCRRIRF